MTAAGRLVALLSGLVLAGCGLDSCVNTPLLSVPSPDGERIAVAFERSCGATTGFSTQVSILRAKAPIPGGEGNVFVARDLFPFSLHWAGTERVTLTFLAADTLRSDTRQDGVRVDILRATPDPASPHTWTPRWPHPLLPEKTNQLAD